MDWLDTATQPVYDLLLTQGREKLAQMYRKCFRSTWDTTLQRADGTVFLITGDIPAMWLRDSSAQVYHYLPHATRFPEVKEAISGLIARQLQYIRLDPYTNAFNRENSGRHGYADHTSWSDAQEPWIWERKYEIDSLCYPVRLVHAFWKTTGTWPFPGDTLLDTFRVILSTFRCEQHHMQQSPYFFERSDCPPSDTLPSGGKGTPVAYTGMTWSGFRPSDDACRYGYLIPSNFFATVALAQIREMADTLGEDGLAKSAALLRGQILEGLAAYGTVEHPEYGRVYAYEVDGLGHAHLMDDANVPSLLSLPYLGCVKANDETYLRTRRMILSRANPYYYEGKSARGIGSPHTPEDYIWPISLCMQGLTSTDPEEIRSLLSTLENLDAGTLLMHEGVHKDDPSQYTRAWFAWANSLFSEFVEFAVS